MTSSRRRLLVATGLLTSTLTAGCLEPLVGESNTTAEKQDPPQSGTDAERWGPTQGRADMLRITETVTSDRYEYVASNDTVRYPARKSGDEVVGYGYVEFNRWVETEGFTRGTKAINDRLAAELEGKTTGLSVGVGSTNNGLGVFVSYRTHLDRDGNVISEPSVTFEQVINATPRRIEVTLHFAGHTGQASSSVTVRPATIQNQ